MLESDSLTSQSSDGNLVLILKLVFGDQYWIKIQVNLYGVCPALLDQLGVAAFFYTCKLVPEGVKRKNT